MWLQYWEFPTYTQRNFIKSNWNQIVFTIFRLIYDQTDFRLVLNHLENGKYNLISVVFNKTSLCTRTKRIREGRYSLCVTSIIDLVRRTRSWKCQHFKFYVRKQWLLVPNQPPFISVDEFYSALYSHRNLFWYLINQNLFDCNYTSPIDLAPNATPFVAKSIRKV